MEDSVDKIKSFTRRAVVLGIGKATMLSLLIGRLYYLQTYQGSQYNLLSDKNRIRTRFIMPPRGIIADRNKIQLAIDQPSYRVCILLDDVDNLSETLENYSQLFNYSPQELEQLRQHLHKHSKHIPWILKNNITWDEVAIIELNRYKLNGIFTEKSQIRQYPYGESCSHLLGYVADYSDTQANKINILQIAGSKEGKAGVEKIMNARLSGAPGTIEVEVDAKGQIMRQLSWQDCAKGDNLQLTIDVNLQQYLYDQLLQHKSASGIVIDVTNGSILASISTPSYDPHILVNPTSSSVADWQKIITDPYKPMMNKVMTGLYHPGSSFKLVVALAALEANLISPNDRIECCGYYNLNQHRYHCIRSAYGHGFINIYEAIGQSCDVFFYILAKQVGIERIYDMATKLGLGQKYPESNIDMRPGLIPNREWKKRRYGRVWTAADTILTSIGQGFVLATPLQLAMLAARIGNRQTQVVPNLYLEKEGKVLFQPLDISQASLETVIKGMNYAVNHPQGTAYGSRIENPGLVMIGKTSTSQNKSITAKERAKGLHKEQHLMKWQERDDSIFIGLAPAHNPKYAVCIVCDHVGMSGSKVAAPIAKKVMLYAQQGKGQEKDSERLL